MPNNASTHRTEISLPLGSGSIDRQAREERGRFRGEIELRFTFHGAMAERYRYPPPSQHGTFAAHTGSNEHKTPARRLPRVEKDDSQQMLRPIYSNRRHRGRSAVVAAAPAKSFLCLGRPTQTYLGPNLICLHRRSSHSLTGQFWIFHKFSWWR